MIDPVLDYSSYLGGTGGASGESIALDKEGNIYVAGTTTSNGFPTANAMQENFYGSNDIFVTKLDPTGRRLIYSTYIGSWGDDRALDIAVDSAGSAYVTGYTTSPEFPVVNAPQPNFAGGSLANGGDAFVLKLTPSGDALEYSTYLGGVQNEFARSIAVDGAGNAYITGLTASLDFPVKNAIQPQYAGGNSDAFVAKLNASGTEFVYSHLPRRRPHR